MPTTFTVGVERFEICDNILGRLQNNENVDILRVGKFTAKLGSLLSTGIPQGNPKHERKVAWRSGRDNDRRERVDGADHGDSH